MKTLEQHKEVFKHALLPVLEMLSVRKTQMEPSEWDAFIERTQASIIRSPDQFLEQGLLPTSIVEQVVKEIISEFRLEESSSMIKY